MSETKWTPGPWFPVSNGEFIDINTGDGKLEPSVANTCSSKYLEKGDNEVANAHLIAASPELYEALENLLAVIYGDGGTKPNARELAEEALKKARGEQP